MQAVLLTPLDSFIVISHCNIKVLSDLQQGKLRVGKERGYMAQVFHHGPYFWASTPGLPPGAQHSWSWGPNPGFDTSSLVATAHPLPPIEGQTGVERRLAVTMIQSHRTAADSHFVHVFVRNVGSTPVGWYEIYISGIRH